jgi:hypothetical protein
MGAHRFAAGDPEILATVKQLIACTKVHVHLARSDSPWDAHTQHRLTFLEDSHFISTFPSKRKQRKIYFLDKERVRANGPVEHLLCITDVHARIINACRNVSCELIQWRASSDLRSMLTDYKLIPDAYFSIRRVVNGIPRSVHCFLEMEHMSRDKQVMKQKLKKYKDLFVSGDYERRLKASAMRVLVVYAAPTEKVAEGKIAAAINNAEELCMPIVYVTSLTAITTQSAPAILTAPIFRIPNRQEPISMLDTPST